MQLPPTSLPDGFRQISLNISSRPIYRGKEIIKIEIEDNFKENIFSCNLEISLHSM